MTTVIEHGKMSLILMAVELGYAYCEKGYSLQEAKDRTIEQLKDKHTVAANERG